MSSRFAAGGKGGEETEDERYERIMNACFRKTWGPEWQLRAPAGALDLLKEMTGVRGFFYLFAVARSQSHVSCCPGFYRNEGNRLPEYKSWIPSGPPAHALVAMEWEQRVLVARCWLRLAAAFDWPCEAGDDGHTVFKYFSTLNFPGAAADDLPGWLLLPGARADSLQSLWYQFARKLSGLCHCCCPRLCPLFS